MRSAMRTVEKRCETRIVMRPFDARASAPRVAAATVDAQAADFYGALEGRDAEDALQRGRLPGAVAAEQRHDAPRRDGKRHAVEYGAASVALADVVEPEDWCVVHRVPPELCWSGSGRCVTRRHARRPV